MRRFVVGLFFLMGSVMASTQRVEIAVIGAGIAGLTAAHRLLLASKDVHVYEARSRVGGRILTAVLNGETIELGGRNITDGGDAPCLTRLIDEYGLSIERQAVNIELFFMNAAAQEESQQIIAELATDPVALMSALASCSVDAQNMRDVFDRLFKARNAAYRLMEVRLVGYEGGLLENLSPLYIDTLYHLLRGGVSATHQSNVFHRAAVKGGNAALPLAIAERLGSRMHLNTALRSLVVTHDQSYMLTFADESVVIAAQVVLAMPCPVYSDIAFGPGVLPAERVAAISAIAYGVNAKIYMPFLDPEMTCGLANDRICIWPRQHELTLYYSSKDGFFTPETIVQTARKEYDGLTSFYQAALPVPVDPVYAKDEQYVAYETPVGYSWPNDPYVKGSYSYIAAGQEALFTETVTIDDETFKKLFAPINNTLFFAGEHVCPVRDIAGTMEAACQSGEQVARVIKRMKG